VGRERHLRVEKVHGRGGGKKTYAIRSKQVAIPAPTHTSAAIVKNELSKGAGPSWGAPSLHRQRQTAKRHINRAVHMYQVPQVKKKKEEHIET